MNFSKSTDSTRCELVRGGLTTRAKPPQGTSARTRRGRSARRHNPTNQPTTKMCGTKEILLKNVRDKGNPIEKCAGQRKSYRKMCGTKEILLKNVRDKGNPMEKCAGQRKSYRKMCGTKEILLKNVRDKGNPIEKCAGHHRDSENPGKNLTI